MLSLGLHQVLPDGQGKKPLMDIPHHPRGTRASASCPRDDADILPSAPRELGILPCHPRGPRRPTPMGHIAQARMQGNMGRGRPRGRAQPVTWFVNDYLMTLGGLQGGVGPPGRLASPHTSAGPCSLPCPSSWILAHWAQLGPV